MPKGRLEHPAELPAVLIIVVVDGVAEKFSRHILRGIDERRLGKSRLLQKALGLRAVKRRLQPAHHRFIREQGV